MAFPGAVPETTVWSVIKGEFRKLFWFWQKRSTRSVVGWGLVGVMCGGGGVWLVVVMVWWLCW